MSLVTDLLARATAGDPRATDELFPIVYAELRRLAGARMARERPGQTLTPTGLVHEAYLRLAGGDEVEWENRRHFFAAAAEAMRRILIERARAKATEKRGGGRRRTSLGEGPAPEVPSPDLLALDEALSRLERRDRGMAEMVVLRYFAGLTVEETARVMGVSPRSVNRSWTAAKAWLYRELARGAED